MYGLFIFFFDLITDSTAKKNLENVEEMKQFLQGCTNL